MPKIVEGEEYLNTQEVMDDFRASKKRFYANIKPYLRAYHFDARKTPWYKKQDVLALKNGKPVRKANIAISGILGDWPSYIRSLGFSAESQTTKVEITTLPEDAIKTFRLPAEKQFVKRSRITFVEGQPICIWDTYYPLEWVEDILDAMLRGEARNIVEHIREKHGIVIGRAKDKYTARMSNLEEQNLFHLESDIPVLVLQRVSYTSDKQMLVLYSDMVLLGDWFAPEHEYPVNVFDKAS